MKAEHIQSIIKTALNFHGAHSESGFAEKRLFHLRAASYLRELAGILGLAPGTYDVRSNKGGIAVLGEVTLHGEEIYVVLSQGMCNDQFMYRKCKGRKDYSGFANQWMPIEKLADIGEVGRIIKAHMEK